MTLFLEGVHMLFLKSPPPLDMLESGPGAPMLPRGRIKLSSVCHRTKLNGNSLTGNWEIEKNWKYFKLCLDQLKSRDSSDSNRTNSVLWSDSKWVVIQI
jgi:hypothetical protein